MHKGKWDMLFSKNKLSIRIPNWLKELTTYKIINPDMLMCSNLKIIMDHIMLSSPIKTYKYTILIQFQIVMTHLHLKFKRDYMAYIIL
jgi:hypothetical protein